MNIFAKATAIFSAHGGSVRLQVILFVELGWGLLKYESKYFSKKRFGMGRGVNLCHCKLVTSIETNITSFESFGFLWSWRGLSYL